MGDTAFAATGRYYRHSGRFAAGGVAVALGVGGVIGVVLGVVYAYVDLYIPIGGWVTFLITGGTGFLMGWIVSKLLKSGKIRNMAVAMLIAAVVSGVLYVASWEAWLYALLQRANQPVSPLDLLTHPGAALELIGEINASGAWTFDNMTPTGIWLGLLWLAEAAALIGIPLKFAWRAVQAAPFCEKCDKWCGTQDLVNLKPGDKEALRGKLEARDFGALAALGKAQASAMHFWHAYFQGCADCDTTQTLCVDDHTLSVDKKGHLQTKKTPLIVRLMLSPEDTVAVATAVAALTVPAPEVAPEGEAPPPAAG
jgi:hypothetical protein